MTDLPDNSRKAAKKCGEKDNLGTADDIPQQQLRKCFANDLPPIIVGV